jgi:hypothetical protein
MLDIISNLSAESISLAAVIAGSSALAPKVLKWLWNAGLQRWTSRNEFKLARYWIGECSLPSYPQASLEIWRYVRNGDRISLKFFSYSSRSTDIEKCIGRGVLRLNKLSAFYYLNDKSTYESGVIALEHKGPALHGVYAQFDPSDPQEALFASQPTYVQSRIKTLPFIPRAKMLFGFPPFQTYDEVKQVYEKSACPLAFKLGAVTLVAPIPA